MKLYVTAIATSIVLSSSISAQSATVCSEKTHTKYGEARIYAKNYIATCRPDGSCAAVTYKMNPHTKKADAPLGWDHRMSISRFRKDSPWKITFTGVVDFPALSEGFDLQVDSKGNHKVMPAFLRQEKSINEVSIDTKLSDIFLKKFKKGSNVRWTYSIKSSDGKVDTSKGRGNTLFSLVGLTKALQWADCAQRLGGF